MSKANLAIYLNDHLAGSVAALGMMKHLEESYAGSEAARLVASLRADVLADRDELEKLMAELAIPVSRPRKAMAWITEKLAEVKLSMDDKAGQALYLLEAVEAIAIGIHGKGSLWRALRTAGLPEIPENRLALLEARAAQQRERIEVIRLDAATSALQVEE